MTPPPVVVANLRRLCVHVLQPLRDDLCRADTRRQVCVTSGWRPEELNRRIGGAAQSQHVIGLAADIEVAGVTALEVCARIRGLLLPFDQLIHEFGAWCHVSVAAMGDPPRGEVLTAWRDAEGHVHYLSGLLSLDECRRLVAGV